MTEDNQMMQALVKKLGFELSPAGEPGMVRAEMKL
jgi:hypothetical protein